MEQRIFQGNTTRQSDGHTGHAAVSEAWYYEPKDYMGDVLWSLAYTTAADAQATADAEADADAEFDDLPCGHDAITSGCGECAARRSDSA